jgi:hypothetical protein
LTKILELNAHKNHRHSFLIVVEVCFGFGLFWDLIHIELKSWLKKECEKEGNEKIIKGGPRKLGLLWARKI